MGITQFYIWQQGWDSFLVKKKNPNENSKELETYTTDPNSC